MPKELISRNISGLYIHIPFCIKKCSYCNFYSIEKSASDIIDQYISMLLKELGLYEEYLEKIRTIYIGGGTPSILSAEKIERLLAGIFKKIKDSQLEEFTFEANPGSIEKEKIMTLKRLAVTRISLGVQSFNERDLHLLSRIHTVNDTFRAIEEIKRSSFDLSIDLIYGIPEQTLKEWEINLSQVEEIKPEHVSVYELTVEEGTLLHREILSGRVKKPAEEEIIEIFENTHEFLKDIGYLHYEISNYAFPGKESIHNLNYWRRGEYIGLGAGAHSFFEGKRIENFDDLEKYLLALKNGLLPYKKIIKLSPKDEFMESIMLGLRTSEGISLDHLQVEIPSIKEKLFQKALPLIENGFLEKKDNYIRPTVKGFLLLNEIINRLTDGLF